MNYSKHELMPNTQFNNFIQLSIPHTEEQWNSMPRSHDGLDPITIRIPKDLLDQVDRASQERSITRAAFVRLALYRNVRYWREVEHLKKR